MSRRFLRPATGGGNESRAAAAASPDGDATGKSSSYIAPDGTLMAVTVRRGGTFEAGPPTTLFKTRIAGVDSLITTFESARITR